MDGMGYPGGYPQVISAAAGGWADMFMMGWQADVPEALNTQDNMGNNWQIYLEDFSSRPNKDLGQKHKDLDVAAPGAWVVGPFKDDFSDDVGYFYLSGTSMAAPHVSAMSALVLESHPDLQQGEMEFILKLAAQGLPLPASDALVFFPYVPELYYTAMWDGGDYGAGFLQADAALQVADIIAK
jgi:subtilisin family serine protease